jgi:hypothetical protein
MTEQLFPGVEPVVAPPRRQLPDVVAAALLVAVATGAVLLGAVAPIRLTALLLAAGAVGLVLRRRTRIGGWELLGTATGVLLAVLAAAGVVLDRLPGGIDRPGWAATAGVVGIVTLAAAAALPVVRATPLPRPRPVPALAAAAAALVVAVAIGVAVTGSRLTDVPPTQMWLDTSADGGEVVAIRAPGPAGPFDVWLEPDGGSPVLLTSGLSVAGGLVTRVPLPEVTVRSSVVLRSPSSPDPVRSLIVEPG